MFIDFHTHQFPDNIAPKAMGALLSNMGMFGTNHTDGTLGGLKDSMKESGIDMAIIQPVVTKPSQFDHINQTAYEINQRETSVVSYGGIHPDCDDVYNKLKYIKSLGIRGIKMHPEYQGAFIDDKRYINIIGHAVELGLNVMLHAGGDWICPAGVYRCVPDRILNVLREIYGNKMPERRRIFLAHLGSFGMWHEVEEKLIDCPAVFDTSQTVGNIEHDHMIRIIRGHGAENIVFATDSPWNPHKLYVEDFNSLALTDEEKRLISHENALRLNDYFK